MTVYESIFQNARAKRDQQDAEHAEYAAKQKERFARMEAGRSNFMSAVSAAPLPLHMYALWLLVHINNGGTIRHSRSYNFAGNSRFFMPDPTRASAGSEVARYSDEPSTSRGDISIPTGYGAISFNMLILPDLPPSINLNPTSGDGRTGWEWGHTTIMTLSPNPKSLLSSSIGSWVATTNQPDGVESFPDVEDLILKKRECKRALETLRGRIQSFDPTRRYGESERPMID